METITKVCTNCNQEKPLSGFSNSKSTKDGKMYVCKECNRQINHEWRQTPSGLYSNLKARIKWTKENETRFYKPLLMTKKEFMDWYDSVEKKCVYCDLPEEEMWAMQEDFDRRVLRLEFECKDNNRGYSLDNIALACHRCNFIKNNILTYDEMREFAQKYLKPRWLEKVNNHPKVNQEEKE